MRSLGFPYEQINTEQMIKRVYNFAAPLDNASPSGTSVTVPGGGSTTFQVTVPSLATHTPTVTWLFDGASVATGSSLVVPASALPSGSHTLQAVIQDTTAMVRNDPSRVLRATRSWTVSGGSLSAPDAPSSLIATSSGSSVTLTWTAPASGPAPSEYVIEAGTATGLSNLANTEVGSTPSYVATGIGAGTYFVRVRAKNSCGVGSPSNESVVTVR
ncbi:MAG: fibronectin type III domain-containing protein [Acidobacteria bacterium]|nr:fibronectin type III domain-containing protein [Acidobacteriota bacterium]